MTHDQVREFVPRDKVKEMEQRLLTLSRTIRENPSPTVIEAARAEYARLHPKWIAARDQLSLDL